MFFFSMLSFVNETYGGKGLIRWSPWRLNCLLTESRQEQVSSSGSFVSVWRNVIRNLKSEVLKSGHGGYFLLSEIGGPCPHINISRFKCKAQKPLSIIK